MIESEMMPCKTQNRIQVDIIKLFVRMAIFLLCSNYLVYNFFGVEKIKNYVRVLAILLIAISIFFKKASTVFINQKREMFLSTCILSIFIILVVIGNGFDSLNIAACFMLAICAELDEDFFDFLHKVSFFLLIIVFVSLFTGVVKDKQYVDTQDRVRNTLGFGNVNSASLFFASYIICFFMSRENIKIYHILYAVGLSLLLYIKTDSRTALIAVLVFLITYIIFSSLRINNNIKRLFLLLEIVLFASPLFWMLPLSSSLDKFLSFRVTFFKSYIANNSIINFLFGGTKIPDVDNFFLLLLFNIGIVVYLLLCCLTLKSTINLIRANKDKEIALIITILTVGLVESTGIRVELGMTVLFWLTIGKYIALDKCDKGSVMIG